MKDLKLEIDSLELLELQTSLFARLQELEKLPKTDIVPFVNPDLSIQLCRSILQKLNAAQVNKKAPCTCTDDPRDMACDTCLDNVK